MIISSPAWLLPRARLVLLSESRLQDQAEAKLYTVALADLDR